MRTCTALHATPSQLIHGYPSAQRRTYMYRAVHACSVRVLKRTDAGNSQLGLVRYWFVCAVESEM